MWFTFAIISAFCASLSTIIEKKVLEKEHSSTFSAILSFLAAIITLPALYIYRDFDIPLMVWPILIVSSLLVTIAFLEVTSGIRHLDISNSAPLFLLSPLMTALLAFVFLGETLSVLQLSGMVLLGVGTYILQTKNLLDARGFLSHLTHDKYVKIILLGLFLYGITSILDRVVLHTYNMPVFLSLAISQILIAINFGFLMLYKKINLVLIIKNSFSKNIKIILLVAMLTVSYRVAQNYAVSLAAVGLVTAVKRSSSLFTTIIGGEIFHEKELIKKSIACLIMILGVFLIAFK